jgi:phosphatidylinositol glycan class Q protein
MSAGNGDNQIRKAAFIDFTRDALLWLDDWPEGLKLNAELSSFLVHTLLGVLELWACGYNSTLLITL